MKLSRTILFSCILTLQAAAQSNQPSFLDNDFNKLMEKDKSGLESVSASSFEKVRNFFRYRLSTTS